MTTTCELIYTRLLICLPSTIYLKQNGSCTMPCRSFHQNLFQNTTGCIFSNLFESLMAASSSMLCLCCQEVCLCIRVIVWRLGLGAGGCHPHNIHPPESENEARKTTELLFYVRHLIKHLITQQPSYLSSPVLLMVQVLVQ